ncbi:hypothetical protein TorRG33x02_245190 [Trema orientale]|uniref:Uncharacterized protein n=1 Tax=Trema orientale TaxID=63057 RepID=A0A2P5DQ51_TREOI|nr:hypothetical protein TorRG33x02_245190 [Trema orientale]
MKTYRERKRRTGLIGSSGGIFGIILKSHSALKLKVKLKIIARRSIKEENVILGITSF